MQQQDVTTARTCPPSGQELSAGSEPCVHLLVLGSSEARTELRTISLILAHFCALFNGSNVSCNSSENQDVSDLHWSTANSHEVLGADCPMPPPTGLSLSPLWLSSYRFILSSSSPHPSLHEPSRRQSRPRSFLQPPFRENPSFKASYTMQSTLKDAFV